MFHDVVLYVQLHVLVVGTHTTICAQSINVTVAGIMPNTRDFAVCTENIIVAAIPTFGVSIADFAGLATATQTASAVKMHRTPQDLGPFKLVKSRQVYAQVALSESTIGLVARLARMVNTDSVRPALHHAPRDGRPV